MRELGLCLVLLWGGLPWAAFAKTKATPVTKPTRIVSCSLASDEIVLALLEHVGALSRLKAVSLLADDRRYSNIAPVPRGVAARCGGELESILALKPDVAIVASFNKIELVTRLQNAGIRTYRLEAPTSLDDIARNIRALGDLLAEPDAASALLANFDAERQTQKSSADRGGVPQLLQFFPDGVVSGQATLFDDLVRAAGAENAAARLGLRGWPRLGPEMLTSLRPDLVIVAGDPEEQEVKLKSMRALPGFKEITAVRDGHIAMIPERELSATSHHVLKALSKLRLRVQALRSQATREQ